MNNFWIKKRIKEFLEEDDFGRNLNYDLSLPSKEVNCALKIKSDLIISGLPVFKAVFDLLLDEKGFSQSNFFNEYLKFEGTKLKTGEEFKFKLPFDVLIYGERIALNLLTKMSSISTTTFDYSSKAGEFGIKILDTRKTTPGLRSFEKYAVLKGGGFNHRLGSTDSFMVKDNHKKYFGSLLNAVKFFKDLNQNYTNIICEIHSLEELEIAIENNLNYLMLDNFSKEMLAQAISIKPEKGIFYEISGGVNLENLNQYLIKGVDFISISKIITYPRLVDISLKIL